MSLSLADPRSWARLISQARSLDIPPRHVRLGSDLESFREEVRGQPVSPRPQLPQDGSPVITLPDGRLIADPPPPVAGRWIAAASGVGAGVLVITQWGLWVFGVPVAVGSLLGLLIRVRSRAWMRIDRRGIAWGPDPGKSGYRLRWEEVLRMDMFLDSEGWAGAGSGLRRTSAVVEAELADEYVLMTSKLDLDTDELVLGYRDMWRAERAFRSMKSVLRIETVHHREERRIVAHAHLCVLAYLLMRIAENRTGESWPLLREKLERVSVGRIETGQAAQGLRKQNLEFLRGRGAAQHAASNHVTICSAVFSAPERIVLHARFSGAPHLIVHQRLPASA